MDNISVPLTGFLILMILMAAGLHVTCIMFIIAMLGAVLYLGVPVALEFGTQFWGATNNLVLVAVPLFVLLGELLVRGGFTDDMYHALSDWLGDLPGGLLHTNIGVSAMLAAVSGSSVATAATISTVAIPALRNRGYDEKLVLGSIAAGATLGIIIPPSIHMLVYGAMVGVPVGRLYLAGIVPGVVLAGLFMLTIIVLCIWRPRTTVSPGSLPPLIVRIRKLTSLIPMALVFSLVMGSIYFGWATLTESAALGVMAALALCLAYGKLSFSMLNESLLKTVTVSSMVLLVTASAFYLNFVIGIMGVAKSLADFVADLGVSQALLLLAITVFYLILGCFMDSLAMMVGTLPIVYPIVQAMHIDPVWFGIYLVLMSELALITPPVGMNLYIVQGVRKVGSISTVIVGTMPFLLVMLLFLLALCLFPAVALWLPNHSYS